MPRAAIASVSFVLALLAAGVASAQDVNPRRADDFETPRGMALGSGVRASAGGTSAVAYNPANLPVAKLYQIEESDQYDPSSGRLSFGGALADSTTDYVHAGVALRGILDTTGHSYSGFDGRLVLAMPIGNQFAIGLAGRYASISRSGIMPAGAVNNVLFERFTMDAAARVTPVPGLHIAAIGTNLISTGSKLAPRLVGGSASYTIDNVFTLGLDVFFDLSDPASGGVIDAGYHWMMGGGVEWLLGGRVPVRLGYFYDKARDVHVLSGGVGYVDPKYAVDLAFRQELETTAIDDSGHHEGLQTVLLLAFRYFVQ